MVIQLKFYFLCMLSGPEKKVRRIVFLFSFFQQNSRWPKNHMLLWRAWTALSISKEATYPGHMLIRFWCDSDITFSRGLHKNLVTVLYFSIINVLCGGRWRRKLCPSGKSSCFSAVYCCCYYYFSTILRCTLSTVKNIHPIFPPKFLTIDGLPRLNFRIC